MARGARGTRGSWGPAGFRPHRVLRTFGQHVTGAGAGGSSGRGGSPGGRRGQERFTAPRPQMRCGHIRVGGVAACPVRDREISEARSLHSSCATWHVPGALSFPGWPARAERAAGPNAEVTPRHLRLVPLPTIGTRSLRSGRSGPIPGLGGPTRRSVAFCELERVDPGRMPRSGGVAAREARIRNVSARRVAGTPARRRGTMRAVQLQPAARPDRGDFRPAPTPRHCRTPSAGFRARDASTTREHGPREAPKQRGHPSERGVAANEAPMDAFAIAAGTAAGSVARRRRVRPRSRHRSARCGRRRRDRPTRTRAGLPRTRRSPGGARSGR